MQKQALQTDMKLANFNRKESINRVHTNKLLGEEVLIIHMETSNGGLSELGTLEVNKEVPWNLYSGLSYVISIKVLRSCSYNSSLLYIIVQLRRPSKSLFLTLSAYSCLGLLTCMYLSLCTCLSYACLCICLCIFLLIYIFLSVMRVYGVFVHVLQSLVCLGVKHRWYTHTRTQTHTLVHANICVCVHACVFMYVKLYLRSVYNCTRVCIHADICVRVCVCVLPAEWESERVCKCWRAKQQ